MVNIDHHQRPQTAENEHKSPMKPDEGMKQNTALQRIQLASEGYLNYLRGIGRYEASEMRAECDLYDEDERIDRDSADIEDDFTELDDLDLLEEDGDDLDDDDED